MNVKITEGELVPVPVGDAVLYVDRDRYQKKQFDLLSQEFSYLVRNWSNVCDQLGNPLACTHNNKMCAHQSLGVDLVWTAIQKALTKKYQIFCDGKLIDTVVTHELKIEVAD